MSDRLYYKDSFCFEFEALVVRAFEHQGRPAVVLDRTAFYPTSGGQPFDTGRLGGTDVLDVVDEGEIVHVLAAPLPEGARVTGAIDRDRRFDHMQQHTGQHVLSAAFDRLFDNRTVSFHMGAGVCTIDLARELAAGDLERAVAEANRVVFEDRAVTIRFASEEEASRLPLRKEPARTGQLRLVEVTDFDLSACGGTHVARTGAIGLIAALGSEKVRGGARVSFVCGGRALAAFDVHLTAVAGATRLLSVLPHELPAAVERAQTEARDLRKAVGRLQTALAGHESVRLLTTADLVHGVRIVATVLDGWDAVGLKAVASALAAHPGVIAALVSSSTPTAAVVARSADAGVDAARILRELVSAFQGRGGGKPEMAQGGGFNGSPDAIVARARELIEAAITFSA